MTVTITDKTNKLKKTCQLLHHSISHDVHSHGTRTDRQTIRISGIAWRLAPMNSP